MPNDQTTPRRRGRPGHSREDVLDRAVGLFLRQGYDATSVGDVAGELGVGKSAVFHHFPSKEAILGAALDEALDALARAVDEGSTDGDRTPYERLRVVVRASVLVLCEHLGAVTLLLRVHGNSPTELAALERRRRLDARLADLVRRAADDGDLRADVSAGRISRLSFGLVNSLVDWYRPGGALGAEALADAVTGLLFDGLRPTPTRTTRGSAP